MISFAHGEGYVAWRLRVDIGLQAEKIAENQKTKTCDFRASDEKDAYWIEVKERTGDERLVQAFLGEEVSLGDKVIGYDRRTASILYDAVKQLDSLASPKAQDFAIVWLDIHSPFESNLQTEQSIATVFGAADILDVGEGHSRPCYFFGESSFFRFKQLDGVVVDGPSGLLLCVNPYARRLGRFRRSRLFQFFRTHTILDVMEEEHAGRGYSALGCEFDRRDQVVMLDFIKSKYSLKAPHVVKLQDRVAGGTHRDEIEARRRRRNPASGSPP